MTNSLDSPLFLLGAPRSGTSLLYKALCLHPEAAYINNWQRRYPAVAPLATLNRVAKRMPAMRQRSWFAHNSNAYVHMHRRSPLERAFPAPAEGEPLFQRCGIPGTPPIEADDAQLRALRAAVSSVMRFGGGTVFVNKRIANNLRIALLVKAFPEARFVHLVRDGRAVAASLARVDWWLTDPVWWYGATPRDWVVDGGDPWDIAARHWVEELRVVAQGLSEVPASRVRNIRYEDLVAAPHDVLREVAGFSGLHPTAQWEAEVAGLEIVRDDRWRQQLSRDECERVEAVQADQLLELGYPLLHA